MESFFSVFNFSGIYEEESFYREGKGSLFCQGFFDLKAVPGTNCMCDDGAKKELLDILRRFTESEASPAKSLRELAGGIHFIDSGNYHYMSYIFLEQLKEPVSLVVLDHHPDMQPPLFGDVLSCGGWILDAALKNPFVRDIHIIGADRGLISELDLEIQTRAHFYDPDEIFEKKDGGIGCVIQLPNTQHPVYLSIDKDVISPEELLTNWDMGGASCDDVISFTKELLKERKVVGIDICGECAPNQEDCDVAFEIQRNDEFNKKILDVIINRNSV